MEDRLQKIESQLGLLTQAVELNTRQSGRLLARHDRALYGADGSAGIVQAVDRLNLSEKRRTWHLRAMWTAMLGGLTAVLSNLFGGFSPK